MSAIPLCMTRKANRGRAMQTSTGSSGHELHRFIRHTRIYIHTVAVSNFSNSPRHKFCIITASHHHHSTLLCQYKIRFATSNMCCFRESTVYSRERCHQCGYGQFVQNTVRYPCQAMLVHPTIRCQGNKKGIGVGIVLATCWES